MGGGVGAPGEVRAGVRGHACGAEGEGADARGGARAEGGVYKTTKSRSVHFYRPNGVRLTMDHFTKIPLIRDTLSVRYPGPAECTEIPDVALPEMLLDLLWPNGMCRRSKSYYEDALTAHRLACVHYKWKKWKHTHKLLHNSYIRAHCIHPNRHATSSSRVRPWACAKSMHLYI